jgi:hypothetical protein
MGSKAKRMSRRVTSAAVGTPLKDADVDVAVKAPREDRLEGQKFLEWAQNKEIWVSEKVELLASTPRGRGVLALGRLEEGEELVRGPWSAGLFEEEDGSSLPPQPELAELWARWPQPETRLAIRLLLAANGPFAGYFDILDHDSTYNAENPSLRSAATQLGYSAEVDEYMDSILLRREQAQAISAELRALGFSCSSSDMATAMHSVHTRYFRLAPKEKAPEPMHIGGTVFSLLATTISAISIGSGSSGYTFLCIVALVLSGTLAIMLADIPTAGVRPALLGILPVVDLVNHDRSAPLSLNFGGPPANGGVVNMAIAGSGQWSLHAGRSFDAGDEVTFSYDKSDAELLARFGFLTA